MESKMIETPVYDIIRKAGENQRQGIEFVMATVVVGAEKTPGRSGFKVIAYPDGKFEGTVGGGKLERMTLEKCAEVHKTRENAFEEYILNETSAGIGMVCGGVAKVFFEYFPAIRHAYVFGAGHLCRSMVPVLNSIGFYCVVLDNREEYADKERIPAAKEVKTVDYKEYVETFLPSKDDAILIFTHGHLYDFDILEQLCKRNIEAKYIGMIGSKIKVKEAVDKVKEMNLDGNLIDQIYAPIGLNIGKTTTQEIAISIAAEILALYNGVDKIMSMRDKVKLKK